MTRSKILMAVYNPIEFDGRVQRACASVADDHEVILICPESSGKHPNVPYRVYRTPAPGTMGSARRLLAFWWRVVRLAMRLRPDIVYVHDFFLPFPGLIAAKLTGAKLVYDAHELIVPDVRERLTPKEWLFYRLEQFSVAFADVVIAANRERAAKMQEHYRLKTTPVTVGNVPPRSPARLASDELLALYPGVRRQSPGDIHVVYMGDINLGRGIGLLLEAAALLPSHFKLVFVGTGPDLERLKRRSAEGPLLDRLRLVGAVPHDLVQQVVSHGDIGFVSYSMKGLNNILCAPNKIFEYAYAGLPMAATCQPTIKRMFDEFPIGRLFGCGAAANAAELAETIATITENLAFHRTQLPLFLDRYSWQRESRRLADTLKTLG
jgi:glycosyltransferase involved in cell wall biosynthesis